MLSCFHSQRLGGSFQSFTKAATDCTCLWDVIEDLTHDVILQCFRTVIKLAFVFALLILQMLCAHEALFPWPQMLTGTWPWSAPWTRETLQNGTASPLLLCLQGLSSSLGFLPSYLPSTCTMDQLRCCGCNFNKWRAYNYVYFWFTWMACLGNELNQEKPSWSQVGSMQLSPHQSHPQAEDRRIGQKTSNHWVYHLGRMEVSLNKQDVMF